MKKIGLVGGTGPESTLMYYKELNSRIDKLTKGNQMPDVVIESVDFRRAWEYVSSGQYDLLTDYLAEKVDCLKNSGAEVISLTAVTMHLVADEIISKTGVSFISIPQAVCKEALSKGYKKIGLFGTIFTMEQDYMKKDFREAGIEVFVPEKDDRELIAKRILEELELGIVKDSTLKEFQVIIEKMRDDSGIEAVVLGCTELPILLNTENSPLPILDSVEIHINELINKAMKDEFESDFAHCKYLEQDNVVFHIWKKEAHFDDYRDPVKASLEMLRMHEGSVFIVDARNGFEDVKEDVDWGFNYFLPELKKTGCKIWGFILPEVSDIEGEIDLWTKEIEKNFQVIRATSYEEIIECIK